jgi:hypothetical protein
LGKIYATKFLKRMKKTSLLLGSGTSSLRATVGSPPYGRFPTAGPSPRARSGPRSQKHRGKHRKEKKKHRRNCKKSFYKDVEKIREQKFERKILKEKNSGKHFKNL